MDTLTFGKRLKAARQEKGLTAEQLSEKIDLSSKSIWQLESGARGTTLPMLVSICNTLNVSPEYLLGADLTCTSSTPNDELNDVLTELSAKERRQVLQQLKTYLATRE